MSLAMFSVFYRGPGVRYFCNKLIFNVLQIKNFRKWFTDLQHVNYIVIFGFAFQKTALVYTMFAKIVQQYGIFSLFYGFV